MIPIDYRNATWDGIQNKIAGNRRAVLDALREYGPCTTRGLSQVMKWDILNVRPRVTELVQLGFAEVWEPDRVVHSADGSQREGIYRAFTDPEAFDYFRRQKFQSTNPQLQLL